MFAYRGTGVARETTRRSYPSYKQRLSILYNNLSFQGSLVHRHPAMEEVLATGSISTDPCSIEAVKKDSDNLKYSQNLVWRKDIQIQGEKLGRIRSYIIRQLALCVPLTSFTRPVRDGLYVRVGGRSIQSILLEETGAATIVINRRAPHQVSHEPVYGLASIFYALDRQETSRQCSECRRIEDLVV